MHSLADCGRLRPVFVCAELYIKRVDLLRSAQSEVECHEHGRLPRWLDAVSVRVEDGVARLTLHLGLPLSAFILQDQTFELFLLRLDLQLIRPRVDGDRRVRRDIQCPHLKGSAVVLTCANRLIPETCCLVWILR